jgi:hypothetical protein
LFFFRLQGEAAAAEELDYETFLAQVKDQSELSFFERQPIGVNPLERFMDQSKLSFCQSQPIGVSPPEAPIFKRHPIETSPSVH